MDNWMDFSKICRLCSGTDSLQNLFVNPEMLQQIAAITDLEIEESDQLPQQICDPCTKMVFQSHNFRLKCHQIDEQLRDLLHFENSIIEEFSEDNDVEYEKTFPMICEEPDSEISGQENLLMKHTKIEFLALDSNFEETVETTEKMDNEIDHLSDTKSGDKSSSQPKEIDDTSENSPQKRNEAKNLNVNPENPSETENMNNSLVKNRPGLKIPVKCRICLRIFNTKTIARHVRFHTDDDVPCSLCDVFEINKWALRSHVEGVHNLNPYSMQPLPPRKCPRCKKVFTHLGELNKHKKTHKKQFECEVCKQVYGSQFQLDTHRKVHIGQAKDGRYPCYKCGKVFAHRPSMMRHEQIIHSDAKPFECNICSATFPTKERLKIHLTFHGERGFMCDLCGQCFYMKAQLKTHIIAHKENKLYRKQRQPRRTSQIDASGNEFWKCTYCNKTFTTPISLKQHEVTHTDLRRYVCDECGMRFKQIGHLQTHRKIHTGEKPYECKFCGKKFSGAGNKKVHERLHTGERPYVCDVCGEGYVAANALKRHKRVKHPEVVVESFKNKNTNK